MIIVVKELRRKCREIGKQVNKGAIALLDKNISEIVYKILSQQKDKRITDKNLQL